MENLKSKQVKKTYSWSYKFMVLRPGYHRITAQRAKLNIPRSSAAWIFPVILQTCQVIIEPTLALLKLWGTPFSLKECIHLLDSSNSYEVLPYFDLKSPLMCLSSFKNPEPPFIPFPHQVNQRPGSSLARLDIPSSSNPSFHNLNNNQGLLAFQEAMISNG